MFKRFFVFWMVFAMYAFATEALKPVASPETSILIGGTAELRDDTYSADMDMSLEAAPCRCLSFYADFSFRFLSYYWDTQWSDQSHDPLNLHVNGFNESYFGVKIFPIKYFGLALNWLALPGEGSQVNRFMRLGVEPMAVYPFSKNMNLGLSAGYYSFVERKNFQPGDELGVKASFTWKFLWREYARTGWRMDYVFLYRTRVEDNENLNMQKPFRKMDEVYDGFRMHAGISRYFSWFPFPFALGAAYEINRGYLFGFETGHRVELFLRSEMP